jgi:arsenite methyltransferase
MDEKSIKQEVRDFYAREALKVRDGKPACCGASSDSAANPITANLYDRSDTAELPGDAVAASLGCGNPTALAELKPGETVLDLGSGGGIDVLLSARRVGPGGKAYGLDMTDEMLALARDNQREAGVSNVEFLKGEIENIPLPDNSVDVIISNCVINLSANKDRVFGEAMRVLRPGGRLAVSDIVVRGSMPAEIKRQVELWAGCIAGALEDRDYAGKLRRAGFVDVSIEPTRIFTAADARALVDTLGPDAQESLAQIDGKFASAFIRAHKPARAS